MNSLSVGDGQMRGAVRQRTSSAALRKPNGNVVGMFPVKISRESGCPPESCAMTLASENRTQRKSSWVGRGPRKVLS
jgi:hypothetical protein